MIDAREDIPRLKNCLQCDYSLEGHLPGRPCPECGFEYDLNKVFVEVDNSIFVLAQDEKVVRIVALFFLVPCAVNMFMDGNHGPAIIGVGLSVMLMFSSRHAIRYLRQLVGQPAGPPMRVLVLSDEDVRVYRKGRLYFCRQWQPSHFVDIGRGMLGWTMTIYPKSDTVIEHTLNINIKASEEQMQRLKEEVQRRIERSRGSDS